MRAHDHNLRVFVVDDNAHFLRALCEWVDSQECLELIGTAQGGASALSDLERTAADLVLLDVFMAGENGFQIASALKQMPNPPGVILLSAYDGEYIRTAARQSGADGFVGKSELLTGLPPLIASMQFPCLALSAASDTPATPFTTPAPFGKRH